MSGDKKWVTIWRNVTLEKPDQQTCVYAVETKDGDIIGRIRWYGAWRQYAFFPDVDTFYEKQCLRDIADFLEEIKDERKSRLLHRTDFDKIRETIREDVEIFRGLG